MDISKEDEDRGRTGEWSLDAYKALIAEAVNVEEDFRKDVKSLSGYYKKIKKVEKESKAYKVYKNKLKLKFKDMRDIVVFIESEKFEEWAFWAEAYKSPQELLSIFKGYVKGMVPKDIVDLVYEKTFERSGEFYEK